MATRKRARTDDGQFAADDPVTPQNEAWVDTTPEQAVSIDSLAAFIGAEKADQAKLGKALDLAKEAALVVTGTAVPDVMPHALRQGVHLLAAQLLMTGKLDEVPQLEEIPLVVRYYWRLIGAGR